MDVDENYFSLLREGLHAMNSLFPLKVLVFVDPESVDWSGIGSIMKQMVSLVIYRKLGGVLKQPPPFIYN